MLKTNFFIPLFFLAACSFSLSATSLRAEEDPILPISQSNSEPSVSTATTALPDSTTTTIPLSEPTTSIDPSQEPGAVTFKPPFGWKMVEPNQLPSGVRAMVIGKGKCEFPPSINLGVHPFKGNMKQYLKIMKDSNDSQGYEWKDLGNIKTLIGTGSLSQVDMKTQWGTVREMHLLFVKNGMAYLMTVASLKEEFPDFYKDFFDSMRSFNINKDLFEMISDFKKRDELKKSYDEVIESYSEKLDKACCSNECLTEPFSHEDLHTQVFESQQFQNESWIPFKKKLERTYGDMGVVWRENILKKAKHQMIDELK